MSRERAPRERLLLWIVVIVTLVGLAWAYLEGR